jgi:predicted ATPase/DNA-binding SARP family transcriptional activator/tetratricopeptide (TPR) repeat protein
MPNSDPPAPVRLRMKLLGGFSAVINDVPLTDFGRSKARGLLAYLALESARVHDRAQLAELFWPDLPPDQGLVVLRQVLYTLSRMFNAAGAPDLLQVTRYSVRLVPDALELDVDQLLNSVAALQTHQHRGLDRCGSCMQHFEPLLSSVNNAVIWSGKHDSPALEQHHNLRQAQVEAAVQTIAAAALARQLRQRDWPAAETTARRWLAVQPWQETAVRGLLEALIRRGERNSALTTYRRFVNLLRRELSCEPEAPTIALAEAIRSGTLPTLPALPAPRTLIGRETEMQQIDALLALPATRLVTLVGIGGSGKSSLAQLAAHRRAADYQHGVVMLAVGDLHDRRELLNRLALELGIEPGPPSLRADAVHRALQSRDMLLILDECEQLSSAAELVHDLLTAAPQLQILCTSRLPLQLRHEHQIHVGGLPLPAAAAGRRELAGNACVQLLRSRYEQLTTGGINDELLTAAGRICRAVNGSPLAVLLAAARLPHLPATLLADQLEHSIASLTSDAPDVPLRQRSLTAIIDESFTSLTADEQLLLLCTVCFTGGFSHETAAAVVAAVDPAVTIDRLTPLIERSLLLTGSDGRLRLHSLVRTALLPRLQSDVRAVQIEDAYRRQVLSNARHQVGLLRGSLGHIHSIVADWSDLRNAWQSATACDDITFLQQAGTIIFELLILLGLYETVRECVEMVLQHTPAQDSRAWAVLRANLENELARTLHYLGDSAAALAAAERAVSAAQHLADPGVLIHALTNRARMRLHLGDLHDAEQDAVNASQIAAAHGMTAAVRALPDFFAAGAIACAGDLQRAVPRFYDVAEQALQGGFGWAAGDALSLAAALELYRGEPLLAVQTLRRASGCYFPPRSRRPAWAEALILSHDVLLGLRHPSELTVSAVWDAAGESGFSQTAAHVMVTGIALLHCGLADAALALLELAGRISRTDHSLWGRRAILVQRSAAELECGRIPDTAALYDALAATRAADDPRTSAHLAGLIGRCLLPLNRREAEHCFRAAAADYARAGAPHLQTTVYAQLARLASRDGRRDEAQHYVDTIEQLPSPYWHSHNAAEITLICAEIVGPDDPIRAERLLAAGRQQVQQLADRLPEPLRATFTARPYHAALLNAGCPTT